MFTRLPSCKITGAILVALVLSLFVMANAPRADASVQVIEAGPNPGAVGPADLHIINHQRGGLRKRDLFFETSDGTHWVATPCKAEDSTDCWWDAKHRGNDAGHSVVVIRTGNGTCHWFINRRYAKAYDYCSPRHD